MGTTPTCSPFSSTSRTSAMSMSKFTRGPDRFGGVTSTGRLAMYLSPGS
ncbi:MAG: hypothetical protein P8M15_02965 [Alphaproteobacteria bacterium]|nr:hypothetical protein [Alphaproteobacteria bacterium]